MLDDSPGDGQAVERRRATADFVQKHETRGRRLNQDGSDFTHLHEKRRTASREIVRRADARENAVGERQLGLARGNKRPHLRQDHDQRGLAQIGGFAAHVRPGDEQNLLPFGFETNVVRDEALAALPQQFFYDRMAPADDEQFTFIAKGRTHITAIGGELREGGQYVEFGDGGGRAAQARGFGGNGSTDFSEELPLEFKDALVGGKNFPFVFLQFRRSETLGIDERLLTFEIRRNEMQIGFGNLDVVAEHLVKANLERGNARALAFALFHRGDDLLAVPAQTADFVKFRVVARADYAGFAGLRGRLLGNGALQAFADVAELIELLKEMAQAAAPHGCMGRKEFLECRQVRERFSQRDHLPWRGDPQRDAAGQPFQVEDALQFFAQLFAQDRLLFQMRDRFEARLDFIAVKPWAQNPGAQEPPAHARDGFIERGQKRGRPAPRSTFGKNRRDRKSVV